MSRVGILLPRSTEYPSISFDLLDGFRLFLKKSGLTNHTLFTENIGFGENPEVVHAAAEKMVLNHDVDVLVVYATSLNAEQLYSFAETCNKPILFLDAGMELFEQPTHRLCYHLTLQGLQACDSLGHIAGAAGSGRNTVFASSFLDGGYRGSWFLSEALTESGGAVCGNFVSGYMPAEFTLAPLEATVVEQGGEAIVASFSSYLASLFLEHLGRSGEVLRNLPVYCSPFLAEESVLAKTAFPAGMSLTAVVPWSRGLDNPVNKDFADYVQQEKSKPATIFHLLGWEAAATVQQIAENGHESLAGWAFESPRGLLHVDQETHAVYGPLYGGRIVADGAYCAFNVDRTIPVTVEAHRRNHFAKPDGPYTRWRNNFFCI